MLIVTTHLKGFDERKAMSLDNGPALAIEFARIEENKNALFILNGGCVPEQKEVSNDL